MGTEFSVAGVPLSGLNLGEAFTIDDRGVQSTGRLADGFAFYFGEGDVSPDATLTFTLVSLLEGDYNFNGLIEQADLDLVLLNWGRELVDPASANWINDLHEGVIHQGELDKVLLGWGNSVAALGAATVPEPDAIVLIVVAATVALAGCLQRRFGTRGCM